MPIDQLQNGDSGLTARTIINNTVDAINNLPTTGTSSYALTASYVSLSPGANPPFVQQIIAGDGITISPFQGQGIVTVTSRITSSLVNASAVGNVITFTRANADPNVAFFSTFSLPISTSLQQVLDYNHDLTNGIVRIGTNAAEAISTSTNVIGIGTNTALTSSGNYVTAIGYQSALQNSGSFITAAGYEAALRNIGNYVLALGDASAQQNSGSNVAAFGTGAAEQNSGNGLLALGNNAAFRNKGFALTAVGLSAAYENSGSYVNALGGYTAGFNIGNYVTAMGYEAAYQNSGSHVNAFGYQAGKNNALNNQFIISNNTLPSYANITAARAAINTGNGASTGCTYLYHDQSTNSIGAVRIP